jgi:predicted ATPase
MSDGTLRFVCLVTALLQPSTPATMLFDEPELGLHPYALNLLGALFNKTRQDKQIIVSTQSVALLNEFEPEDVIVVDGVNNESIFRRIDPANLSEWLKEYSIGELWEKNVLDGRPDEEHCVEPLPSVVVES